jgi:putative transposase
VWQSIPAEWPHSGYPAIQQPPKRYRVVDLLEVSELCGFDGIREFQKARREWVEARSSGDIARRDDRWSESIAVGSRWIC